MRLVIDMQAAQTASRFSSIGRYTLALTKEMVRQRGENEILLALNATFAGTIEPIRTAFADLLSSDSIKVYEVPSSIGALDRVNGARRKIAERMVEAFYCSLQPDLIFIPSLFEGVDDDAVTSVHALHTTIPIAVTLHYIMPMIHRDIYLQDQTILRWYYSKIDQMRRADLFLAVSDNSGRQGVQYLNIPESSVVTVKNAYDVSHFHPISLNEAHHARLATTYGIDCPFIMSTGCTEFSKDIESLINAFARLPPNLHDTYSLALVGQEFIDQKIHFLTLARQVMLQEDKLIFIGSVSDSDLALLYNACTLFAFPCTHDDFALPVLEAMACGKAVVAANSFSLPEVIGRRDTLFDARDDVDMSVKMTDVLQNIEFRKELECHALNQTKKFSWPNSASQAWKALTCLHNKNLAQKIIVTPPSDRRHKLAFVSPLPPEKTGIADYSTELLPELARHYDITVIVQQDSVSDPWVQANSVVHDAGWFRQNSHEFDRVLYQFGNSHFHSYMLDLLAEIPGLIVLHDFYLGDFFWHLDLVCGRHGTWARNLLRSHGWQSVLKRFQGNDIDVVTEYPCNLVLLQHALGVIVHSDFSRQMVKQHYGVKSADGWEVIPLLRQPAQKLKKVNASQILELTDRSFIVCSFGLLGPTKFNHRLLDAWLASPLSKDENCHLVFVGENHNGDYGFDLSNKIAQSSAKDRIAITGWVSEGVYRTWLAAADIGVQLRSLSRGETSAAVLDCMNFGLPTIVNAHGSMAELPNDAVWQLPDDFSDAQLIEAITNLWQDIDRRTAIGARAKAYILQYHSPRLCADQYARVIETTYAKAGQTLLGMMQTLSQLRPALPIYEYSHLSEVLSVNFPPHPKLPQLMLDVSAIVRQDLKSGIERVTRALLEQILLNPPAGWSVQLVFATADRAGYRYARQFTCDFMGIPSDWVEDAPVQVWADDIFLGLDFYPHVIPVQENILLAWWERGIRIYFVVYDLLPIFMPEVFPEGAKEVHHRWLQTISRFDGALAISRAVADDLYSWLQTFGENRQRPFSIYWFHLGADVNKSAPTTGMPADAFRTLALLKMHPAFLMVGTIEPRKGVLQTLLAFDQLWKSGVNVNLVIVGREGWKLVPDYQRRDLPQTVKVLRSHPERGNRLFWLEDVSDEYLEQIYAATSCLIAASYGEGFGLPLIEAARQGLPILARDIPVFREVTQEKAFFFDDLRQPEVIIQAISDWLALFRRNEHPCDDVIPHLIWAESARRVLDVLAGSISPYRLWDSRGKISNSFFENDRSFFPYVARKRKDKNFPCDALQTEVKSNYLHNFIVVNKTYKKDLDWSILLYESYEKFCLDPVPFVFVVPQQDIELFLYKISHFKNNGKLKETPIIISEEDLLTSGGITNEDLSGYSGWLIQQVIKLIFWIGFETDVYLTLDSASCFVKPFNLSDIFFDANGKPKTFARRTTRLERMKNYEEAHEGGFYKGVQVKNLAIAFDGVDSIYGCSNEITHYYNHSFNVFSAKNISKMLIFLHNNGINKITDALRIAPYEFTWYGAFVYCKCNEDFIPMDSPFYVVTNEHEYSRWKSDVELREKFVGIMFQPPIVNEIKDVQVLISFSDDSVVYH